MWNIVIGIVFVIGGFSGEMALRGADSSEALVVVGFGLIVWGLAQVSRQRSMENAQHQSVEDQQDENQ